MESAPWDQILTKYHRRDSCRIRAGQQVSKSMAMPRPAERVSSSLPESLKGDVAKVWEKNSMAGRRCGKQGGHTVIAVTYLNQLQPEPNVEQTSIRKGCVNSQEPLCTEKKLLSQTLLSFNSKKAAGNTGESTFTSRLIRSKCLPSL